MKYSKRKNDYPGYLEDQIGRAESKWGRRRAENDQFKENLRQSWSKIRRSVGNPISICCMGCRAGTEVFEFKEFCPKAQIYGVDITDNIKSIKTHLDVKIELHDFNHLPEDWENKFDLIFSNSLDHAFNVEQTIAEWRRVTAPGGYLFLELSTARPTNIEYQFKMSDKKLFKDFELIKVWEEPKKITVVVKK